MKEKSKLMERREKNVDYSEESLLLLSLQTCIVFPCPVLHFQCCRCIYQESELIATKSPVQIDF